jgi:hypothetical protein
MGRRKRLKLAVIARRLFFFVAGSLLVGFLAVFLNAVLGIYMPRHFSISLAVGISVAITFWLLRLLCTRPLFLATCRRRGRVARAYACTCAPLDQIGKTWHRNSTSCIGAGPGGYIAAIRAARSGVRPRASRDEEREGRARPGRTLPQRGCIPSRRCFLSRNTRRWATNWTRTASRSRA